MNHQAKVWRPSTDVYEIEAGIVVKVEIAGMREEDFHIELLRRKLIISGRRTDNSSGVKLAYHQMEVFYGDFRTEVYLPWSVDPASVEATYQDGFLTVVLPRATRRRVPISEGRG